MAFFEDLGKMISQTSQGAVQKAKDSAEVSKLKGIISDEEKRINAICTEIGKRYFELHTDSYEPVFSGMIKEIQISKNKIESCSEQIKKLKGIVTCPKCNTNVQAGTVFCSTCGTRLIAPALQNANHCTNCGAVLLNPNSAFCTSCGHKINQGPAQKLCPTCGNNVGDSAFCINCGTKIVTSNTPAPNLPFTPTQPVTPVVPVAPAVPVVPAQPIVPAEPEPVVMEEPTPVAPAEPEPVVMEEPTPVAPTEAEPTTSTEAPANVCDVCGVTLEEGTVFCTNCGSRVAEKQPEAPINVVAEETETIVSEEPEQNPIIGSAANVCSVCGAVLEQDTVFCTNCGSRVDPHTPAQSESAPVVKRCSNCGKESDGISLFCSNCGIKL